MNSNKRTEAQPEDAKRRRIDPMTLGCKTVPSATPVKMREDLKEISAAIMETSLSNTLEGNDGLFDLTEGMDFKVDADRALVVRGERYCLALVRERFLKRSRPCETDLFPLCSAPSAAEDDDSSDDSRDDSSISDNSDDSDDSDDSNKDDDEDEDEDDE